MSTDAAIKTMVKEKYSEIAEQSTTTNQTSCCGATSCCGGDEVYNIMADDYTQVEGYVKEADLGLGCGLPTGFAQIKPGDTVIDLGSGAGNDAFIARKETGATGKVIGIDFTEKMIAKAKANTNALGYENVTFLQGDIENIPVNDAIADVAVSNCVLNLVPNKQKVFIEIFRVLKPGGHFSISDIVLEGTMPEKWKSVAELYAGCISGAIQKKEYLAYIEAAGFINTQIQKEKEIVIPQNILQQYLSKEEIDTYNHGNMKIVSITVYADKPLNERVNACMPGGGCC